MPRQYNEDGTMTQGNLIYSRGNDGWWHSTTTDEDQEWVMTPINPEEELDEEIRED